MASLTEQLDALIADFFSSWNTYTTVLAVALGIYALYPLFFFHEPDTHPLLLARQARPAPVRQPGESAVYRSVDAAHGFPLRSGLNVQDADTPRLSAGRDGDLRDIWRRFVAGGPNGERGSILGVYGTEGAEEQSTADISRSINAVGAHWRAHGGKVAVYLPNCTEYLSAVFACAFYGLAAVLVPFDQPHPVVIDLLKETGAEYIVAEAGSLPLELLKGSKIKGVTWVVPLASRKMDWTGSVGKIAGSTWHDIVGKSKATDELPKNDVKVGNVTQIWLTKQGVPGKIVEFTQGNLVAAIAGLAVAIPQKQRLNPADLVLPADSFSSTYVLCNVMAALYSHASLAINSVAGPGVDLRLATRTIAPTVIIASAESMVALHLRKMGTIRSFLQRYTHSNQVQALVSGRMPSATWLFKLFGPPAEADEGKPGKLRLILVPARLGTDAPPLTSAALGDLRVFTRARICHALTAPDVAGAVAQTNAYDYRVNKDDKGHGHFGAPLSCCEIKLASDKDGDVAGSFPEGEIEVVGPSVAGGETRLGVRGRIRGDCTLALV